MISVLFCHATWLLCGGGWWPGPCPRWSRSPGAVGTAGPGTQRGRASWCCSRLINTRHAAARPCRARDRQQEHYPDWISPPRWCWFECLGVSGEWNDRRRLFCFVLFFFFFIIFFLFPFSAAGFRMHKGAQNLYRKFFKRVCPHCSLLCFLGKNMLTGASSAHLLPCKRT